MLQTGLDRLRSREFDRLIGRRFGVVCNQATIARDARHVLEILDDREGPRPSAVFGPQHGLWGHTQDNMVEWEGASDSRLGVPIYSLYGERRKPAREWLDGLDLLVIDLPDIGSRYYTFIWTMARCLEACDEIGLPVLILDRPNPIGGTIVEGPGIEPGFESFVGLKPIPIRHGATLAELAHRFKKSDYPAVDLHIESVSGWDRAEMAHDTRFPWAIPSPNMPSPETALVYPGACLLEGTNLSEGRGTTRPFEMFGAPWLDGFRLADELNERRLPGVHFRPIQFQPTFQKHVGELCGGCFAHVFDRATFRPVATYVEVLRVAWKQSAGRMQWKLPPYEYELETMPIDILWGGSDLRESIGSDRPVRLRG